MEMQVSLVSFCTHEYTIQRAHLLSSQNRKPKKKRHNLRQSICAGMGVQPIIRTDAQCAMHLWVNRRIAIRTRKCSLCDSTFCSIRRLHWFSIHWLCHDKAIDFERNYELLRTKINTFINDTAHRPDRRSQHGELFVNSYDVHNAHESEAISEYFIIRDEIKQNTETTNSEQLHIQCIAIVLPQWLHEETRCNANTAWMWTNIYNTEVHARFSYFTAKTVMPCSQCVLHCSILQEQSSTECESK